MAEEYWDTFDDARLRAGRTVQRGADLAAGDLHVVIHVCLFNADGEMLIQRRADDKRGWPGMWDFSTGGSVTRGESSRQGAEREVFEELGVRFDLTGVRPSFTFNFHRGFDDFYLIDHEVDISDLAIPNAEVAEARWAGRDEVLELLGAGLFIPYRRSAIEFVFDFRGQYDIFDRDALTPEMLP